MGRLMKTHCGFGAYLGLGFHAAYVDASEPVKKRPLKFFLLQRSAPRLTLPPKGGFGLTPMERRGYKNDSHSLMIVLSKYSLEFG